MLQGPDPVEAIRLICLYKLHHVVFCVPEDVTEAIWTDATVENALYCMDAMDMYVVFTSFLHLRFI